MTKTNRIALIDNNGRLCTCNADGSEFRVLTRRDRLYQFPAWSPDGNHIAAVGSDRTGAGVYLFADEQHGEQHQLYRSSVGRGESPFYLYWSPDSQHISFIANHPVGGIGFHLVPRTARAAARLVAIGQPFFWQWGLDSAEIFIHAGVGEAGRLTVIDPFAATHDTQNLDIPGYFQTPGFSFDGKYIAYGTLDDEDKPELVIERRSDQRRMRKRHRGAAAFTWNPVRNELAWMAPQDKTTHFYGSLQMIDSAGRSKRLTRDPILAFFWSPDGNHIAYFSPTRSDAPEISPRTGDIIYTNGHNPPRMERPTDQAELLRLELWVIDLQFKARRKLLTFQPTRMFLNQFLPFFDQYALSHHIWSPNSDAIVLPLRVDETNHIAVIPFNSREPIVLSTGYMGFWSHT